jgi:multiple sugar transport system substrate-binding protein
MFKKLLHFALPLALILSMLLAACGTTATPVAQTTEPPVAPTEAPATPTTQPVEATAPPAEPTAAPTTAPTEAPQPAADPTGQTITFWHVWGTGLPNETMLAIVDDFNTTNEWGITVEALDQGNYSDLEDAFNAAVQSGDIPDMVTGYTNAMANWYAVDAVVDLTPYVNDPALGLTQDDWAAFYSGAIEGGKAPDGKFFAFPISQSANVIFYNSQWANELGFDNPPTNYEEFKAQACAAAEANNNDSNPDNDGTGGLVLYTGASNVASFTFANGGTMLNADKTGYDFTDQTVVDVADFWKDLWDSGCAYSTESYPNPEFATRKAIFTISSTAGLPYQISAFEAEDAIQDEWTLIPFPGKDGGEAVDLFGQYVAIGNTNPERMMATWVFLKYLTSPETQAKWIEGSAYYPTRSDTLQYLDTYNQDNPIWAKGLTFLQYGMAEPAWPSWTSVRRDIGDTFSAILQGTPADIPSLLSDLNDTAAQAIIETQQ